MPLFQVGVAPFIRAEQIIWRLFAIETSTGMLLKMDPPGPNISDLGQNTTLLKYVHTYYGKQKLLGRL